MERFTHSIKVLWRSERLLLGNELRLGVQKAEFNALAGLVAVFGLVMLGIAIFFALVPYMGYALAGLVVGVVDLLVAGILFGYAKSLKPTPEIQMIKDMRDMALNDIEEEVAQAEADLMALKSGVTRFARDPMGTIVPGAAGPLVSAVIKGVASARK